MNEDNIDLGDTGYTILLLRYYKRHETRLARDDNAVKWVFPALWKHGPIIYKNKYR